MQTRVRSRFRFARETGHRQSSDQGAGAADSDHPGASRQTPPRFKRDGSERNRRQRRLAEAITVSEAQLRQLQSDTAQLPERVDVTGLSDYGSFKAIDNEGKNLFDFVASSHGWWCAWGHCSNPPTVMLGNNSAAGAPASAPGSPVGNGRASRWARLRYACQLRLYCPRLGALQRGFRKVCSTGYGDGRPGWESARQTQYRGVAVTADALQRQRAERRGILRVKRSAIPDPIAGNAACS